MLNTDPKAGDTTIDAVRKLSQKLINKFNLEDSTHQFEDGSNDISSRDSVPRALSKLNAAITVIDGGPSPAQSLEELYAMTGLTGGERFELPDGTIMSYRGPLASYDTFIINSATAVFSNPSTVSINGTYEYAGNYKYVREDGMYRIERQPFGHFSLLDESDVDAFDTDELWLEHPTEVSVWYTGLLGGGNLLSSEFSTSPEMTKSNWINETTNTILTPTNESKLSLTEIVKGVQIEVSNEGNRIEQYLGEFEVSKRSFSVTLEGNDGAGNPYADTYSTENTNPNPNYDSGYGEFGGVNFYYHGFHYDTGRWHYLNDNVYSAEISSALCDESVNPMDADWSGTTLDGKFVSEPVATEANWNTRHSPQQLITEHVIVPDVVDLTNGYYDFDFAALFPHVDLKKASIEITAIVHINTSARDYGARVMMDMVSDAGLALANRSTGTIGYEGDDLSILGNSDSSAMFMHFKVPHGSLRASVRGVKQNYIHADWWVTGEDIPIAYLQGYVNDPASHHPYMLDYAASGNNADQNQNETLMWHRAAFSPMTVDPTRYRLSTDRATAILNIRDARVTISYPA